MGEEQNTSKEEKLSKEREDYLRKLRQSADAREESKKRDRQVVQQRSEHATEIAEGYKKKIQSGLEFRGSVRDKMLQDFKDKEQILQQEGQKYRSELRWFADRDTVADVQFSSDFDPAPPVVSSEPITPIKRSNNGSSRFEKIPETVEAGKSEAQKFEVINEGKTSPENER